MNAFIQFAENHTPAPVKARRRALEKRAEALAANAREQDIGLREYRRWRKEGVAEALAGPHGPALAALIASLKATTWDGIDERAVAATWATADTHTQAVVRSITSAFIVDKRVAAGLPPFDDQIPF